MRTRAVGRPPPRVEAAVVVLILPFYYTLSYAVAREHNLFKFLHDVTISDFSAWEASVPPSNLTLDGTATPGDPTIPGTAISTTAGDYFEANQTGSTGTTDGATVVVDGGPTFAAVELSTAAGSPTFGDTGTLSGELVWIGQACTLTAGDALLNAADVDPGDIAVVRRGACEFQEKADAAASLGASAVVPC